MKNGQRNGELIFLNDFHRKLYVRQAKALSQQPRQSFKEVMRQYDEMNPGHAARPPYRKTIHESGEDWPTP